MTKLKNNMGFLVLAKAHATGSTAVGIASGVTKNKETTFEGLLWRPSVSNMNDGNSGVKKNKSDVKHKNEMMALP